MTPRRALLLVAIAQTARARSAPLAAIASNPDYANRLYGSSNAIDQTTLRIVWPDLMPPKLRASLRVDCDGARTLFYERHFLQRRALWVNLEKLRNATEHVDYIHEKAEAARQRARLAEAHRNACVGGRDELPVGRLRGLAGWGVLLYRFMIGAETTVIVLLLWVAAAGRAPAVGCRAGHIKISI